MGISTSGNRTQATLAVLSRRMGVFCVLLMLLLPIAVVVYWFVADGSALATRANLAAAALAAPLTVWQRCGGAALTLAALAPLLIGLWHARLCFVQFAMGQVFTQKAVSHLRHFAGWSMAASLAGVLVGAAVSVLLTWNNPPGQRHLAVGIGTDQVFAIFVAGMVWLMAAVIGQGQEIAEENAAII